jgi:voltage-gated potassium channel
MCFSQTGSRQRTAGLLHKTRYLPVTGNLGVHSMLFLLLPALPVNLIVGYSLSSCLAVKKIETDIAELNLNDPQGDHVNQQKLRQTLYDIIFGFESKAGRLFDLVLIYAILISVLAVMLDSVQSISEPYGTKLLAIEWFFTILFTIEYGLRIYSSPNPWAYVRSFYGIVDLLSIIPTYLTFFFPGARSLLVVRLLRVLRIFRVLKLARYMGESNILLRSLAMSRRKILIFFASLLIMATIIGSLMFLIEGPQNGFTSIPTSIYWTIVTITTVGYGDITPLTPLGKALAAMAMLIGYSIIAVPTGIVTSELASEMQRERSTTVCPNCNRGSHERDSQYCRFCGADLPERVSPLA